MNVLTPIAITDAMIGAGTTIAEPAASETAWVSGGTYAVGDLRIRSTTHKVYSCVQAHTGRTALPENDSAYWLEKGPTLRWAPFDIYSTTQATATTSITYVLSPGYFNALALYALVGSNISITLKDAPGGATLWTYSGSLYQPPLGWYEYLFGGLRQINRLQFHDLPIRPTAELTITVTASSGQPVGIGMINVGDRISLIGTGDWGGTQYGANAEPTSYSYIKTNADGTTSIVRRPYATGMRATIALPRDQADAALEVIRNLLDVPVSWIATDTQGYDGLNVFGLGSATVSYDSFATATINLTVKGMI